MSFRSDFENATGWNAVDTNKKLTNPGGDQFISFLKQKNVRTVIRYYASSRRAKTIDADEAKLLVAEGFAILPVYQDHNRLERDFSFTKGEDAAGHAADFAEELKQPDGSTILFAVDSDLRASVVNDQVSDYFRGIKSEFARLGRSFRIGVYGSGLTCQSLTDQGLAEVPWLSMSRGFSGTRDFFLANRWMLRQVPFDTRHASGFSFDRDLIRVPLDQIGAFTYDSNGNGVVVGATATLPVPPAPPIPSPGPALAPSVSPVPYPGHIISRDSGDGEALVKQIQRRLNEVGYGPLTIDGDFGSTTRNVVRDFQAENDDLNGNALDVDGKVGELTWNALFNNEDIEQQVLDVSNIADLGAAFVAICRSQVGVREDKPFVNRGPRVDGYIRSTGVEPFSGNFPWCVAFLYWCALKLCTQRGIENPMPKTAGVHRLWEMGQGMALDVVDPAQVSASTVRPGMIFAIDRGNGKGHAGVVVDVSGSTITTIEGNTNKGGSREGFGVFERTRKLEMSSLLGYLDFWGRG